MTTTPTPPPAPPAPVSGLHTSVDAVLRLVLGRTDATRATPASVRAALAAAGVIATDAWCADWLARSNELRQIRERNHNDG